MNTKINEIIELLNDLEQDGDIEGLEEIIHQAEVRANALKEG